MSGVAGKRVLVAGAATGIGAATARHLGENGARLHLGDINTEGVAATAKAVVDAGGEATSTWFDLHDRDSIQGLVAGAVEALGGLDAIVNVAADFAPTTVLADVALDRMDPAVWDRTFAANLTGYALLIKHALEPLTAAGGGAIVNTSSGIATVGEPDRPAYAASKAGINALTRHVAVTYGARGIRANAVAPGLVLSESVEANLTDEFKQLALMGVPLGRHGQPADLAHVIGFLVSDESSWVTGQVLNVNGGSHRRD